MNVSPLVDILLVLVLMFGIGVNPYAHHRLTIGPKVTPLPVMAEFSGDAVTIVAAAHERVLVDGHPFEPAMLRGHAVIVEADSGVVYRDVFHAVDIAVGAGARVVRLAP